MTECLCEVTFFPASRRSAFANFKLIEMTKKMSNIYSLYYIKRCKNIIEIDIRVNLNVDSIVTMGGIHRSLRHNTKNRCAFHLDSLIRSKIS